MLRWQKLPTPKFQVFVHEALQAFLAETTPGWIAEFPRLGRVFTEDQARDLIADLFPWGSWRHQRPERRVSSRQHGWMPPLRAEE